MESTENKAISKSTHRKLIIYSSVIYLLANLTVYFISELIIHITAISYGLESYLFEYKTVWLYSKHSVKMTAESGIAVSIAGPLSSLILGILCYRLYIVFRSFQGFFKIFLLWSYLHAFNYFMGGFIAAVLTGSGFGFIANWIDISISVRVLLSVAFLFILSFTGSASSYNFLESAYDSNLLSKSNRHGYLLSMVFMPWFYSSIFLIILSIQSNKWYDTIVFLTMVFAVMPVFKKSREFYEIPIPAENKEYNVPKLAYGVLLIFLITYRLSIM